MTFIMLIVVFCLTVYYIFLDQGQGDADTSSFSDKLPIFNTLVFTYYVEEGGKGKAVILIHGLWPCNKVGDKLIPLRNCEQVTAEIHTRILQMIKSEEGRQFRETYWKAMYGNSTKFMIYECKTHNIYQKKILNLNYCNDVVRLSSKFLVEEGNYNLPQFMIKFKEVLAQKVKMGHKTNNRYAMNLLRKMAKNTYGVDVQVKNLKKPDYHIRIAFLLDPQDQLIDYEENYFSNVNVRL